MGAFTCGVTSSLLSLLQAFKHKELQAAEKSIYRLLPPEYPSRLGLIQGENCDLICNLCYCRITFVVDFAGLRKTCALCPEGG